MIIFYRCGSHSESLVIHLVYTKGNWEHLYQSVFQCRYIFTFSQMRERINWFNIYDSLWMGQLCHIFYCIHVINWYMYKVLLFDDIWQWVKHNILIVFSNSNDILKYCPGRILYLFIKKYFIHYILRGIIYPNTHVITHIL